MTYNLFLDDIRNPFDFYFKETPMYDELDWIIVRNYNDFVYCVTRHGIPDVISFDHDLGFDLFLEKDYEDYDPTTEKTGNDCARWLINYCLDHNLPVTERIFIHSQNPVGAENIKSLFETYKKTIRKWQGLIMKE